MDRAALFVSVLTPKQRFVTAYLCPASPQARRLVMAG